MVKARDRAVPYVVSLLAGVLAAALGPGLVASHSPTGRSSAEGPFVYAPPPGFVRADDALAAIFGSAPGDDPAKRQVLWVWNDDAPGTPLFQRRVNVSVAHATKSAPLDEASLSHLAEGMPATYAASGQTWTPVRHAVHVRPDGGRVGVLEGSVHGGPFTFRSLQYAFPETSGAAIVTASFADQDAARWEAAFDATLDTATGLVIDAAPEPPSARSYLTWGAGGALLAFAVSRGLLAVAARSRSLA